jgi:hypothetical protein
MSGVLFLPALFAAGDVILAFLREFQSNSQVLQVPTQLRAAARVVICAPVKASWGLVGAKIAFPAEIAALFCISCAPIFGVVQFELLCAGKGVHRLHSLTARGV